MTHKNITFINSAIAFIALFALSALVVGCSSKHNQLTDIEISAQGKSIESRTNMAKSCQGFRVTEQSVAQLYQYAATNYDEKYQNNYLKLPCFSSGTAYFNDEKFNWVIRSGGIAEFYNDKERFTKICGVKCCKKLKGIC